MIFSNKNNFIISKFLLFPVCLVVIFWSGGKKVWADPNVCDYFVKNDGNDSSTGLSDEQAWRTITKARSVDYPDGTTVCFKRGDTFQDNWMTTHSDINDFTIRDYGEGARPHFNGDVIMPIQIESRADMANVTIMNIDISGQDWWENKSSNIMVTGVKGVTIDGIFGDGFYNGNMSRGKTAITVNNCSGTVVVRNCELYNWGPSDLPSIGQDFMGIAILNQTSGTYEIYNNTIHDINADCLHPYLNTAPGSVHNNTLYNGGEQSIDIKGSSNMNIYENTFYRTPDFTGEGGSGTGGTGNFFIIANYSSPGYANNNIIKNNYFTGGNAIGIRVSSVSDAEISYNKFMNVSGAIDIGNNSINTLVHHNVAINGPISENNSGTGTKIYNNTLYTEKPNPALSIGWSNGEIKNNIAYQAGASLKLVSGSDNFKWEPSGAANEYYLTTLANSDPDLPKYAVIRYGNSFAYGGYAPGSLGAKYHFAYGDNNSLGYDTYYIYDDSRDPDSEAEGYWQLPALAMGGSFSGMSFLDHNCYFQSNNEAVILRSSIEYFNSDQAAWRSKGYAGELLANPLFISSSDFHLQAGSPAINAGTDVGLTSDFDGHSIVGAPDIGAYEFQGGTDIIPPESPSGLSVR